VKDQKIFYWIVVSQRKLLPYITDFEKTRNKIMVEYTTDKGKGAGLEFTDAVARLNFDKDIFPIMEVKEEIPINKIKLETLLNDTSLDITPELVYRLGPLVELDESAE
jgi:hypothetical protein